MLIKQNDTDQDENSVDLVSTVLSVGPRDIHDNQIPDAEVEIRTVLDATEDTATAIMDVAERLGELAGAAQGKMADELMDLSTKLFEASSFQDLCGQRLNKVMRTMDSIAADLYIISMASGDVKIKHDAEDEIEYDENGHAIDASALLRGPQKVEEAASQADIDALLSDFD